jgi:hypothetical protein
MANSSVGGFNDSIIDHLDSGLAEELEKRKRMKNKKYKYVEEFL